MADEAQQRCIFSADQTKPAFIQNCNNADKAEQVAETEQQRKKLHTIQTSPD